MMNGLFLTPLLFGLASAAQPAQDAPEWGEPRAGVFYAARVPAGWKNPFPEDATHSVAYADFGGQSGRIDFSVSPMVYEPTKSDWMGMFRAERIRLYANPAPIKVGRLHGYQAMGVETMLPGVNPGGQRGFLRAKLVRPGAMYHISCDCPAADLKKWLGSFQAVIKSFRPR